MPARRFALTVLAAAGLIVVSAPVTPTALAQQPELKVQTPEGEKSVNELPELKMGDKAPALTIASWPKGEPVKGFEKGKAYVVEFWATWCQPCVRGIPHLTELQKKHKDKVTFIGVSTDADVSKVGPFVEKMGDKMGYTVAVDSKGATAQAYLAGVRVGSIPHAFVVDQDGKVVWHGNPNSPDEGFESVLGRVAAGKFNLATYQEEQTRFREAVERLQKAADGKDWAAADKALDEIAALRPEQAAEVALNRFTLYTFSGEKEKAMSTARSIADGAGKADPKMLQQLVQRMLGTEWIEGENLAYTVDLARRSLAANGEKDALSHMLVTEGLAKQGKFAEAAEAAKRGLGTAEEVQQKVYFENRIRELEDQAKGGGKGGPAGEKPADAKPDEKPAAKP